jgi:hypothetical protein
MTSLPDAPPEMASFFQSAPSRSPSRAPLFALAPAAAYPLLFLAVTHLPPFWLLFRSWELPHLPPLVTHLAPPPRPRPQPQPPPTQPAPPKLAVQTVHPRPQPAPSHNPAPVQAVELKLPPVLLPAKPAPTPPLASFQREQPRFEALGRQPATGPDPNIIISNDFQAYEPVMRAYQVEIAIGCAYPASHRNTYLYSVSSGHLHQDRPPKGSIPRQIPSPLSIASLQPFVQEVADKLGVDSKAIQAYALYPESLHYSLVGKVREALGHTSVAPACAVVSFIPRAGSFDVAVSPLSQCPVRLEDAASFHR